MENHSHGQRINDWPLSAGIPSSPLSPSEDRGERVVSLSSTVTTESILPLIGSLLSYDAASTAPIHLYLCSGGGDVFSGLSLIDVMLHVESPVFTYCLGICASMAAIILAAGERGHRYILPHSRVMIHQSSGRVAGKMEDLKSSIDLQASLESDTDTLLAKFTGKTIRNIRKASRVDKWMTAREAHDFGIIDFLLEPADLNPAPHAARQQFLP